MKIIFLIFILILTLSLITCEACGLKYLKKPKRILVKQEDDIKTRNLKEESWEKIKIHLDFSAIENNIEKFHKRDLKYLKEHIMSKAKSVFEKLLKVRPVKKKLKLLSEKCDDVNIPESYREKGGGVDADLVIFVALDDTGFYKANRIEAAATYCLQDENTRRPIAGFINFRPSIDIRNSTNLDYMVWLALHEMTHIFVFNDSLYEDFVDENLQTLNIADVVGSKVLSNQKKMNYLKTKNIIEKGKKHFNCTNLEGIPLEYMGGIGTSGSHWSKRVMNTDFMIGDSYGENLISEISLAIFEDSGWYKVDFDMANLFVWGKNKGCEFLNFNKKCIREKHFNNSIKVLSHSDENNYDRDEIKFVKNITTAQNKTSKVIYTKNKNSNNNIDENLLNFDDTFKNLSSFPLDIYETDFSPEFCTKLNYPVCSTSHIFRGNCKIKRFKNPLSTYETYFKDNSIGGVNSLANKCPIPTEDKQHNLYYSGSCRKGTSRSYQLNIEKICPECSCFMSNLIPEKKHTEKTHSKPKRDENNQNFLGPSRVDSENSQTSQTLPLSDSNLRSYNRNRTNVNDDFNYKSYYRDEEDEEEDEKEGEIPYRIANKKNNRDLVPILTEKDFRAMCFEFKCKEEKLIVLINNEEFECNGGKIKIDGYKGEIICPSEEILCDKRYKCKYGCTERYDNNSPKEEFD